MADDPVYQKPTRALRTFTPEEWAQLPPPARAAYNNLRRQRQLPPRSEPTIDLSPKPHVPPPKPFDPRPAGRGEVELSLQALARLIARDQDHDGAFFKELKAATVALLAAHDGDTRALVDRVRTRRLVTLDERQLVAELLEPTKKRAAHRPKPLTRELAEHEVARMLDIWDRAAPQEREKLEVVLAVIKEKYSISRSEALKIRAARKRERR